MASSSSGQAFIDESLRVEGATSGPLAGLTVAIKDLFDVSLAKARGAAELVRSHITFRTGQPGCNRQI